MPQINEVLQQLYQAHGVPCEMQGEWVIFRRQGIGTSASIVREIEQPNGLTTVQMDVLFAFAEGRTIVESFAGLGESQEKAAEDAMRSFAANSFHVLLAAFFKAENAGEDQASSEEWVINGIKRRVTFSRLGLRGKPPVDGARLAGWFQEFEQRLRGKSLESGIHWIRLYYASAHSRTLECEVRLDNDEWSDMQAEMQEVITALNWPPSTEFYSIRSFLVIHDEDQPATMRPAEPAKSPPSTNLWRFWKK